MEASSDYNELGIKTTNPIKSKCFIYTLLITDGITLTMCIKMCKGFNNPGT